MHLHPGKLQIFGSLLGFTRTYVPRWMLFTCPHLHSRFREFLAKLTPRSSTIGGTTPPMLINGLPPRKLFSYRIRQTSIVTKAFDGLPVFLANFRAHSVLHLLHLGI